ncbi:MAG: phytoene desaturase family protein [Flavobacteriales bacterium]|nr:phytoene desaturase family protein [Flavobacteriales bacterium]
MEKKVLIVGSGLGALSTALRLSSMGYSRIKIVEKYHSPGGRLNILKDQGFTFDMGPSFFSMSYEFDELFKACGMNNPLKFRKLDPLYSVNFAGSERLFRIFTDLDKLAAEFEGIEPNFKEKAQKYLENAGKIFHDTEYKVVKSNFNSTPSYLLSLAQVPWKHAPRMFYSMWTDLENTFESEEAKVIFSLVAFFLGATPFDTPAVYKLLSYTELVHDGYWNVEGGMYKITEAMVKELEQRGVQFEYGVEISDYIAKNGKVTGFTDTRGNIHEADIMVVNADAASFRGEIFKRPKFSEEKLDKMDWTLAPFTIYLGVKGKIEGLNHHNYFLGSNFRDYADKIFKLSVNPEKPYYYVTASSKSNPECAPEGCENLFILCPVPDMRYKPNWSDAEALADVIIKDLGDRVGYDISSNIITKIVMPPTEWKDKLNLYKGSGLGLAHGLNQIGAFRPKNQDEEFDNVFYVGASTTPGTGLPMVVISSRLAVERIAEFDKKQEPVLA